MPSNSECKKQKVFVCVCVCFQIINNNLRMKHSFSVVFVVILSPSFGFPAGADVFAFQT